MTDYVKVKPDLQLPRRLECVSGTYGDGSYTVEFTLEWADARLRYEIEKLAVQRQGTDTEPVTGTVLRSVRVQQALEHVMHNMQKGDHPILQGGAPYELPYEWEPEMQGKDILAVPRARSWNATLSKNDFEEARLLEAARLHVIGEAFGARSLRLVQDVLQVTQRSASRLIDKARERGLIDSRDNNDA
jgi:hypothetical protein